MEGGHPRACLPARKNVLVIACEVMCMVIEEGTR